MPDHLVSSADQQARLVRALRNPALYGDWCAEVRLIETHISYVLLTGRCVFKIKKAVDLGFLDFTTLAGRRFYCERELALNRRLAPALYLRVDAITGAPDRPRIGGDGPAIEYAVTMREFPQEALLTNVLERGALTADQIDALASTVAAFHLSAARAAGDTRFGSAAAVLELAIANFTEIEPLLQHDPDRRLAADLRRWTEREHASRAALFTDRRRGGFVRECHGDLHLGNIALVDGAVTIFDCVEFNESMRWSDVTADVGFLVMDLQDRRRPDLASRFLNRYLERTGDYDAVPLLRYYIVYRAMVRAKVAYMRARQTSEPGARDAKMVEARGYLNWARVCSESRAAGVVVTRGPSGSGKTTQSQALVELAGAVRIRTDVERKRLHGLDPQSRSGSRLNEGLYAEPATERTYSHVARLTRAIASAGYPVVVDGAFLARRQRQRFRELAADLKVPFVIVDFAAPAGILRARVRERHAAGLDSSEADVRVLEHQLRTAEPLAPDERTLSVTRGTDAPLERSRQAESWRSVLERLNLEPAAAR